MEQGKYVSFLRAHGDGRVIVGIFGRVLVCYRKLVLWDLRIV